MRYFLAFTILFSHYVIASEMDDLIYEECGTHPTLLYFVQFKKDLMDAQILVDAKKCAKGDLGAEIWKWDLGEVNLSGCLVEKYGYQKEYITSISKAFDDATNLTKEGAASYNLCTSNVRKCKKSDCSKSAKIYKYLHKDLKLASDNEVTGKKYRISWHVNFADKISKKLKVDNQQNGTVTVAPGELYVTYENSKTTCGYTFTGCAIWPDGALQTVQRACSLDDPSLAMLEGWETKFPNEDGYGCSRSMRRKPSDNPDMVMDCCFVNANLY